MAADRPSPLQGLIMHDIAGVFAWNAATAPLPAQYLAPVDAIAGHCTAETGRPRVRIDFVLPYRRIAQYCRAKARGAGMFGNRKQKLREHEDQQAQERFEHNERTGKDIYGRAAELKKVDRADLPAAVLMLFREAKHQSELIRRSITDQSGYDFASNGPANGDLATYLARGAALALRNHATSPQTLLEVLSEQSPEVHFTIKEQDAISLIAAMIREQRIDGILEGLRLAGSLNVAPKSESRSS